MRALLASPFGFLIGLALGAVGGGGSILAVPVLVYVAGEEPRVATTTSLVVVGIAAAIGMTGHHRAGRVRVRAGVTFGLAGVGGSVGGSALNDRIDGDVLLLAFSALIVVAAWRMVTACPSCTREGERMNLGNTLPRSEARLRADPHTVATFVGAGTVVGFFTGLFGVGGGFIIVPALTLLLTFTMPEAIGTSLLIISINSAVALATRVGTTGIPWRVTVPFAVASVVGVTIGARVADRLPARTLLRWFAGLLVAVACYTAVSSALALV